MKNDISIFKMTMFNTFYSKRNCELEILSHLCHNST